MFGKQQDIKDSVLSYVEDIRENAKEKENNELMEAMDEAEELLKDDKPLDAVKFMMRNDAVPVNGLEEFM